MATGQSQKSMTLPSRTQPPKPGNHRNKLSSPSFNRGLFGRLVQKLRFRNRDTDTEFPDSQNVEGLYFKRKLSPEHKDPPNQSAFARVDVRRSQSDRSYQRPVEMRKKTGAFPKLRRSRHSKEVAEILPPHDKKPLASDIEVANDFIISDGAGVDLDEGNKEEQIPLEDIDPGYETLDEVREKMKNLKLKKLKEEVETKAPVHVQHHRRTQSTGGQEEAGGRENSEFDISSKERLGMNSSHIDLNRPNSQQLNSRNHLLPNLTSNILSVRSGSCPLHHENSLQTGILSSQNKSENCLSQGGVVWKETEDVYANPSIVHNKTKQGVENTPEGPSMLCSAMNREESVDKEPPPLPERQYSVQSLEDIDASEQVPCNRDPGFSDHVSEQDSNHTTQEADTIPKSLEVKVGPEDEEENGYSTCGSSVAPFQRRERIYEEIKDRDFRTLQCSNEEDTTACSVPYQTYVRKERPYEDIKDLQLDSGICNTSSGTDFFAQVMNHYDSLSENVSSAGPCDTSADDLETDCGSESNKTCENMELLNAVVGANSAKTDSAVTDMSLSSDQPISNFNSFSSSVEQCDTVKMKTTTQEKGGKSDLVDFQPQSNSATTDSLECRNVQANLHTEQKDKVVIHSEYPPRIEASYEDDADLVLESLHSQAIPSGVSSIENLLEYERSMEDSMKKLIDVDSADKWEEIPYADSASLGLGDTPQSLPDDGYSECGDVQQDSAAVSLIIMESDLGCDQDSASQTVATEESGITSTGENKVEKEEVSAVKGAMGGDLQEENVQNIPNEVVEVQWRPKELPHKTIPSFYYDEEPVHMSLSELGMKEKFNKHSKEKETHKKKQKEGKSSSPRQQSSRNSSQVKASGSSRIKVRDSSLRQTAVHKNPAARRTYPMGMAKSLETEKEHKDPVETKLSKSATSSEKPCRDVKAKSSFVEPVTLPEIPKFNQNSEVRCRKDFLESMKQLKDCGWYWGPLSWDEAEIKLLNKPDGSFLVRDSSDERYILSLSFNMNGHVHHTRIEHHKGKFSFWSQPDSLGKSTIKEFIEQCVRNSRNGQFLYFIRPSGPGAPPMPVHLLHPVSRFRQMQSLQHMCRFQILQIVRRDHIEQLPIPTSIKDYLRQSQYYVEYLED